MPGAFCASMRLGGYAWAVALSFLVFAGAATIASAQEKKGTDTPRVIAVAPLEATRGAKTALLLRGLKLDTASAVRIASEAPGVTAELGEKKKATLPNGAEASKIGDTQVAVILSTPESLKVGSVKLAVITPDGSTPLIDVPVLDAANVVEEKEPNGSFREAQPIPLDRLIRGCIKEDKDVDVYRFEGHAGMKVSIEVRAARLASLLDGVITLYNASGSFLGTNDDADGRDPRLSMTLPADGGYLVSVTDAQDTGSPWHCYELLVKGSQ